jgi:hypothetical protein
MGISGHADWLNHAGERPKEVHRRHEAPVPRPVLNPLVASQAPRTQRGSFPGVVRRARIQRDQPFTTSRLRPRAPAPAAAEGRRYSPPKQ